MKGNGINVCKALIPRNYVALYAALFNLGGKKVEARQLVSTEQASITSTRLSHASVSLIHKRKGAIQSPLVFLEIGRSKSTNSVSDLTSQPSISAAMENVGQMDIRKSNNSQLQMAIADFFTARTFQTEQ